MDPVSNVTGLAQVADLLQAHDHYVLVPHVAPDPDAFGAVCGLAVLLARLGKTVVVYTDEAVPEHCRFLGGYFPIQAKWPDESERRWRVIFLDGGERSRLPVSVRERPIWMNLDHHEGNGCFADWIYVDTLAAATSYIVAELLPHLGLEPDADSASSLFAGILFDTRGGFITDRCTPALYRQVAQLVEAGARPDYINRMLHEQLGMGDFKLYGEALNAIATAMDGQIVYTSITQAMLKASGGGEQAIEMLTLNLPKIAGGEVYILFKETPSGNFKLSFRSKGRILVNLIAKHFAGGGHRYAAGGRVEGPLAAAVPKVLLACESAIQEQSHVGQPASI
jgi:phosphoesterase RecJ-like protein